MKQVDYKILTATDGNELEGIVNIYLRKGWQCQGGITVVDFTAYIRFYQAVVRE